MPHTEWLAFVRKTKIAGHIYLYRVQSYRDGEGKVKHRLLEYLGALNPVYRHHTVSILHTVHAGEIRDSELDPEAIVRLQETLRRRRAGQADPPPPSGAG